MLADFIITLRETLEAALIVGIVTSFLIKTKQRQYFSTVWFAVVGGIGASIGGALVFNWLAGGLSGRAEEIFEGVTMLIGAGLLTTFIAWMTRQRERVQQFKENLGLRLARAGAVSLFSMVFLAILREGIETVLFLKAARFATGNGNPFGAIVGIAAAVLLGYALYRGSLKINIRHFFAITGILLILFSAGLVAHGIHELGDAQIIPTIHAPLWDINPPLRADGSYPLWHEDGHFGSFLVGLFGYNGDPSLAEILGYLAYLAGITLVLRHQYRRITPVRAAP